MILLLRFLQTFLQELQNVSIFNLFVISFTFIIASALLLFMYNRLRHDHEFKSPPSPPKLPVIGNLHQLGTRPHRSLEALSKKYGPLMLMHIGSIPTLVISSPELVKEMTKSHDNIFSNRPKITAAKLLLYGSQDVVFGSYDENWRHARKVCTLQLLTLQRVQSFHFVRIEEVESMIEKIRDSCIKRSNNPINLTEMLISDSNDIISRCVFGKIAGGEDRLLELTKAIVTQFGSVCYGDSFPWLKWLDVLTGVVPTMKQTSKEWDSCMDQVIEEHKLSKITDHQDFVDILLQLETEDSHHVITHNMLKAILMNMIVAGTETTSTTMEWTMAELMKNPKTMKKAQEEVRRIIGKKTKIDKSDIDQMEYLKCVIKEALRLHSPLPLLIPRETSTSVKLGGYDIHAKTQVLINAWAIHRDREIWGNNSEEFVPERFENNAIDFRGQDFEFIPFGVGRRGCPGISFGVMTIEYSVANLLYWFDWALPQGSSVEDLDMNEVYTISAPRKFPLQVVPTMYCP